MIEQSAEAAKRAFDDPAVFADRVQGALDDFLDEQAARLAPLGDPTTRLLEAARTAITGGKRLRAAFCWWGYFAVRPTTAQTDADTVLRACAALELLHASALVHDDVMDASDTRRGRSTTHREFEAEHRNHGWRANPESYGASAAILLGDLLLSWADELLRRCGLPIADMVPALAIFDVCRSEVIAGQFLDVSAQARGHSDVESAMAVLRYKSAKYSVERPLQIGAALAEAEEKQLAQLSEFGLPLGEAFQLRDDLLGVFGDPATTGKPAGDDLVEGKRTVLIALALDNATANEAADLDAALGEPLSEYEAGHLRAIIERSGARARVETMIDELLARALAALADADLNEPARGRLRELAAAATRRDR